MTSGKALVSLSIKAYAVFTNIMVFGCIILTTIIYKIQGGSKVVPMISDTWVEPPGSYVSRWMIGNGAGLFAIINVGLYFIENANAEVSVINPKWILAMTLVASFLLSWLAAICENHEPSCMGNPILNFFCAAGFFALYDLSMLLTYINRRKRAGKSQWGIDIIMVLQSIIVTLIIVMSRLLLQDESDLGVSTFIAVLEWINVFIVLVLTIHCVFTSKGVNNYGVGFVDTSVARFSTVRGEDVSLVWAVSAYEVSLACVTLYLTTLGVSCVVGLCMGYLPKVEGEFWYISDMWVDIPGDWISRWGGIQGSHLGYLMQVCLLFASSNKSRGIGLIISEIAMVGLSIVAVCNEKENPTIHFFGAGAYFGGYDIFILLTLFDNCRRLVKNKDIGEMVWIWMSFLFGIIAVVSHLYRLSSDGKIVGTLAALLEWTDALAIIGFAFSDVRAHSDCAGYVFGIFRHPTEDRTFFGTYELMTTESILEFPRDVKTLTFV